MREPIEIIEIDQDFCSLSYSMGACGAELGTTGNEKCFNTIGTCQVKKDYTSSILTLKYCSRTSVTPRHHLPFLKSVKTKP